MDSVDRMIAAWARVDPTVDASPLEVVGRLLKCAQHCERLLSDALRTLGLSFADFDVINTLRRRADPEGTKPGDLARSALVTSGAMTARVIRLERAGLVTRVADPADGRAVRVRLTSRGEALAVRGLEAVIEADETFLAPLAQRDRDRAVSVLKSLLLHWEAAGVG